MRHGVLFFLLVTIGLASPFGSPEFPFSLTPPPGWTARSLENPSHIVMEPPERGHMKIEVRAYRRDRAFTLEDARQLEAREQQRLETLVTDVRPLPLKIRADADSDSFRYGFEF